MPIAVFTEIPRLGSRYRRFQNSARIDYAGGGIQKASMQSRPLLRVALGFRRDINGAKAIDAFFDALGDLEATPIFWRLPSSQFTRTDIVLPNASAGQTVFQIPAGNPYGGDYPLDNQNAILKRNGTPVAKTVQTEARTMTASAGFAAGDTVHMSYDFYRKWLADSYEWIYVAGGLGFLETTIELEEHP